MARHFQDEDDNTVHSWAPIPPPASGTWGFQEPEPTDVAKSFNKLFKRGVTGPVNAAAATQTTDSNVTHEVDNLRTKIQSLEKWVEDLDKDLLQEQKVTSWQGEEINGMKQQLEQQGKKVERMDEKMKEQAQEMASLGAKVKQLDACLQRAMHWITMAQVHGEVPVPQEFMRRDFGNEVMGRVGSWSPRGWD